MARQSYSSLGSQQDQEGRGGGARTRLATRPARRSLGSAMIHGRLPQGIFPPAAVLPLCSAVAEKPTQFPEQLLLSAQLSIPRALKAGRRIAAGNRSCSVLGLPSIVPSYSWQVPGNRCPAGDSQTARGEAPEITRADVLSPETDVAKRPTTTPVYASGSNGPRHRKHSAGCAGRFSRRETETCAPMVTRSKRSINEAVQAQTAAVPSQRSAPAASWASASTDWWRRRIASTRMASFATAPLW